jgi:1-acyl-sn-glycerol-3-phosphate acyltransferase
MRLPHWRTVWYGWWHVVCRLIAVVVFRYRVWGSRNEEGVRDGGLLVCSNHQSHFDPVLVGLTLKRQLNFLARETLFGFAPFRWLIQSLNAIPIDREGFGLSGIKETLRRLKRGEAVLVFPEGTRTSDGEVAPLKPGFCTIARRGKVPLLPVAIEGAFDAWPRRQKLPRISMIHVSVGPPIMPEEIRQLSDDELLAELQRRIGDCHAQARAGVRQATRMRR